MIGYSTIVSDTLFKEISKDEPNKEIIVDVLNESYKKMSELLGDITNAHQIVYETHITDLIKNTPTNLSDTLRDSAEKAKELLEGVLQININTENDIYTAASKTDIEILLTDLLYRIISYEIPPSVININLEQSEDNTRALLTINGEAGETAYTAPPETESAKLMKTSESASIFERKFCENVNGLIIENETDKGLVITVEADILSEPGAFGHNGIRNQIEFEAVNERFSPVTLILSKFNPKKTYVLPQKDEKLPGNSDKTAKIL
jgi:hypothetical protein